MKPQAANEKEGREEIISEGHINALQQVSHFTSLITQLWLC